MNLTSTVAANSVKLIHVDCVLSEEGCWEETEKKKSSRIFEVLEQPDLSLETHDASAHNPVRQTGQTGQTE